MCLIIHLKNKESLITKEQFTANLDRNKDGTGIMFAQDGKVIVKKALGKSESQSGMVFRTMKHFKKGRMKELFIHSRFATAGNKDNDNCHPYQVLNKEEHGKDLYVMHNGIISVNRTKDLTKSDTFHFLNEYLKPILVGNFDILKNPNFMEVIESFIGKSNKLVMLDSDGISYYANKCMGTDYTKDIWISNENSGIVKKYTPPIYTPPAKTEYRSGTYSGAYNQWSEGDQDDYNDYYPPYKKDTNKVASLFPDADKTYPKWEKDASGAWVEISKKESAVVVSTCEIPKKEEKVLKLNEEDEDELAINHGIKLLCVAALKMSENELFTFITKEPVIATEMMQELLTSKEIVIGRL